MGIEYRRSPANEFHFPSAGGDSIAGGCLIDDIRGLSRTVSRSIETLDGYKVKLSILKWTTRTVYNRALK